MVFYKPVVVEAVSSDKIRAMFDENKSEKAYEIKAESELKRIP